MIPSLNTDTLGLIADALARRALEGKAVTEHTIGDFVHTWTDGGLRDDESAAVATMVLDKMQELRDGLTMAVSQRSIAEHLSGDTIMTMKVQFSSLVNWDMQERLDRDWTMMVSCFGNTSVSIEKTREMPNVGNGKITSCVKFDELGKGIGFVRVHGGDIYDMRYGHIEMVLAQIEAVEAHMLAGDKFAFDEPEFIPVDQRVYLAGSCGSFCRDGDIQDEDEAELARMDAIDRGDFDDQDDDGDSARQCGREEAAAAHRGEH